MKKDKIIQILMGISKDSKLFLTEDGKTELLKLFGENFFIHTSLEKIG